MFTLVNKVYYECVDTYETTIGDKFIDDLNADIRIENPDFNRVITEQDIIDIANNDKRIYTDFSEYIIYENRPWRLYYHIQYYLQQYAEEGNYYTDTLDTTNTEMYVKDDSDDN